MSNVKDVDGAVAAAWERVRTHDDMVNYVVVTATGKKKIKLKVAGSGGGGFDQVLGLLEEDKVQFGAFRVTGIDERGGVTSTRPKYILVTWCGEKVGFMQKAGMAGYAGDVARIFEGVHVKVTAHEPSDFTKDSLEKKLRGAGGAHQVQRYDWSNGWDGSAAPPAAPKAKANKVKNILAGLNEADEAAAAAAPAAAAAAAGLNEAAAPAAAAPAAAAAAPPVPPADAPAAEGESKSDAGLAVMQKLKASMWMLDVNDLEALFKRFDADGGGTIGKDEFTQALAQAKKDLEEKSDAEFPALAVSAEDAAAIFGILDKDGSGSINYAEFVGALGDDSDKAPADEAEDSDDP